MHPCGIHIVDILGYILLMEFLWNIMESPPFPALARITPRATLPALYSTAFTALPSFIRSKHFVLFYPLPYHYPLPRHGPHTHRRMHCVRTEAERSVNTLKFWSLNGEAPRLYTVEGTKFQRFFCMWTRFLAGETTISPICNPMG